MKIAPGKYLMGLDLTAEDGAGYLLVPVVRNIPRWEQARSIARDEFENFMHARIVAENRRREKERGEFVNKPNFGGGEGKIDG